MYVVSQFSVSIFLHYLFVTVERRPWPLRVPSDVLVCRRVPRVVVVADVPRRVREDRPREQFRAIWHICFPFPHSFLAWVSRVQLTLDTKALLARAAQPARNAKL